MLLFSSYRFRLMAAVLLAAPLLLRADGPAAVETLEYVKPESVANARTRQDASGHRGIKNASIPDNFVLLVLSPEHTGLTVQEHPSIFWFMNLPVKGVAYKLTIIKDGDIDPIFEKQLDPEKDTGIQRLNLNDISKSLEAGAEYQVLVTVIQNANQRSTDLIATARIKRITAPEKLLSKLLSRPTPAERAIVYARQGIWYDALAAISDQIAADPGNKQLHAIRAALLEKVGLNDAANFDKLHTTAVGI